MTGKRTDMSSLSLWERDSLKGKVTIEERVGYDKKTHGHEFPLSGGERGI